FSNEFNGGIQLKYSGSVTRTLIRDAAARLTVDTTVTGEVGKIFTVKPIRFAKLVSATSVRWRSLTSVLRFGNAIGQVPFDERFTIGLDRDSDLWLRAHPAVVDGRKNASNTSRAFVLTNSDYQRRLLNTGWIDVSAGPFLDTGKSSISTDWLLDTGIEVRVNVFASFGINVYFGRSLKDAQRSLFVRQAF